MRLPIAIHKDDGSVYGVTVPDVPGCFSCGDTVEEAISNTEEAIYSHLELLLELGDKPEVKSSSLENLTKDPEYAGAIWGVVSVDLSRLDPKPERVNISLPRFILAKIDAYTKEKHETRSGFLARAAMNELAHIA